MTMKYLQNIIFFASLIIVVSYFSAFYRKKTIETIGCLGIRSRHDV